MSDYYEAEKLLTEKLTELLDETITVSGNLIPFFTDGYEGKSYGIALESVRDDELGSKHHFGGNITIALVVFTLGQTKDFQTEITSKARKILKASVGSGIELEGDLTASFTFVPSIVSSTSIRDGLVEHRTSIELVVRVDEL